VKNVWSADTEYGGLTSLSFWITTCLWPFVVEVMSGHCEYTGYLCAKCWCWFFSCLLILANTYCRNVGTFWNWERMRLDATPCFPSCYQLYQHAGVFPWHVPTEVLYAFNAFPTTVTCHWKRSDLPKFCSVLGGSALESGPETEFTDWLSHGILSFSRQVCCKARSLLFIPVPVSSCSIILLFTTIYCICKLINCHNFCVFGHPSACFYLRHNVSETGFCLRI
jgi:hypothetical protein